MSKTYTKIYLKLLFLLALKINLQSFANDSFLKIPLNINSISLDPANEQDVSSLLVSRQINCQLIREQSGVYKNEIAKSIRYISPLQIEIVIKENSSFTDGTEITANDVVASFNYLRSSKNTFKNLFLWIKSFEAKGSKTILVTLKKSMPQFLQVLSTPHFPIFQKIFLKDASENPKLWKYPIGCGGYKIKKYKNNKIDLEPIGKGFPIRFYIVNSNQIDADKIDNYDIVFLNVEGKSDKISSYNKVNMFDPSQVFIGLNSLKKPWTNRDKRCEFLSQLNTEKLLDKYGSDAEIANDFFPTGTLGFNSEENFFTKKSKNIFETQTDKFCLAYYESSIPTKFKEDYFDMVKKIYPNLTLFSITSPKNFGSTFIKSGCDALIISLKSVHFDGYDYLYVLGDNDANFIGAKDKKIISKINNSQYIENSKLKSEEFRKIIHDFKDECYLRPLITIPMRKIYIRKDLNAPDIGQSLIDSYYLGNVVK